jgi:hypothetical protein
MKTPREVLLEHHQTAIPRLDAIRRKVLERERRLGAPPRGWSVRWLATPWRELIWPCRRIWAGLAVVWLVIVAANVSLVDHPRTVATKSPRPSVEMILAFWRQERSLGELIDRRPSPPVAPPKPAVPQPRSQRHTEFLSA